MRRPLVPLVAVLLAGILAGGAVGVIVGASSVPQIKACVTKTTKVLRYTTAGCATGEKLLTWNITGPQGAPGATGATGAQGPAGAGGGGGSAPLFYQADGPGVSFMAPITVVQIKLPAGSYLVDLQLTLTSPSIPPAYSAGTCIITPNVSDPIATSSAAVARADFIAPTSVAIRGYVVLSAVGTIYGRCTVEKGANVTGARLIATAAQQAAPLP